MRALTWATILAILSGCSGGATIPNRTTQQSLQWPASFAARSQARSCKRWEVVAGADPKSTNASLYGVAGDTAGDVWSVGGFQSSSSFRTLAELWDGTTWKVVHTPNVGSGDNQLAAVTALSSANAWAFGASDPTSTAQTRTLIEHWNGTVWKAFAGVSPGQLSDLGDVKAISPTNIWAVGAYFNEAGNQQTLVEHWNGKSWKLVSSPSPGASYNSLSKLAIVSAKNVWAVGATSNDGGNTLQTLVERWNGKTWQVIPSLNAPNAIYSSLGSVIAIDANDIWAVGSSESYGTYVTSTLVERWTGSSWRIVASPNMGPRSSNLADVAALSRNDLWAVGSYVDTSNFLPRTLMEHWSGNAWHIVKSPSPGTLEDQLHGVARVGTTLWSVGNQATSSDNEPLITRLACD